MLVFILTYGIVNKKNKNILVFLMQKEIGDLFWLQSYSSYGGQGGLKTNSLESGAGKVGVPSFIWSLDYGG